MGRKYPRFRATSEGGSTADDGWAFEVVDRSIVFYKIAYTGFFKKQAHYHPTGAVVPITKDSTVDLWMRVPPGSGMCQVQSGKEGYDFHVYGEADAFVAEVEREIRRCRAES